MSGAQPRRSCTVCAFMVDLLGSQIDAWNTRTVSLPPSGRAVLGADLNCSESRWGAADPPAVLHPIRCGRSPLHCRIFSPSMSALGQEQTKASSSRLVCFSPESGQRADLPPCPLSAISVPRPRSKKSMVSLFDHPVGACEYCVGYRDAKYFCRPQIDRQLDLRGLLDRKISRLGPSQYLLHVFSGAMIHRPPWRPITHKGAGACKL